MTGRFAIGGVCVALLLAGCGGGSPPPNTQDTPPPLDDPGQPAVAPASSAKVKEGRDAIQAGDFEKAKQVLTAAQAETPDDPQAAFFLGVALENLNDAPGATAQYEKALSLDPKLVEASINLSALLLDAGDGKHALEIIDKGLQAKPGEPDLLMNRALALEAGGDKAAALDAYKKAVDAKPDKLDLRYAYAELLAGAGKSEEAQAELEKVTASDDPKVLAAAANLYGKLGVFAKCVGALDKAIEKQSAPALLVRRGVCRHGLKDDAGAKKDYEAAIASDDKFAPAHFYLGQHLKAAGKKKEAIAELKKAAELGGDQGVGAAAKKALAELGVK
ncbi:MAG: tetratricopeptide repeat protein [Myxococcales bacterium]|nr:tetratricopeptide repeat protein [Myxococcales bacterium]MCB9577379.1 tetratricopeptide repeat protein [Polyangiaceae bacterium]